MKNAFRLLLLVPLAAAANNIETWNTVQATKKIDDWSFSISEENRIGVDQKQTTKKLDEFHTTFGVNYSFMSHFSIGVQDDYALLRDGSDTRYKRDNRPGVNVAAFDSINGFFVMNRSRFVMRDIEGEQPYFRYRNLSKLVTPSICSFRFAEDIKLFTAYEWYFDEGSKDRHICKNDKFGQFWTDFGICGKINDSWSIEVFYRLVEVKSAISHDWSPGHAVCTSILFAF